MVNQNSWKDIVEACKHSDAELIAVSKTQSIEDIQSLYDLGQKSMGENRVQELLDKKDKLPEDIQWHLIGHLQRNKVKYIAPFVCLIHAVDSIRLLKVINKEAAKNDRTIDCLLQFHIAQEESKFGIQLKDVEAFMNELKILELDHVCIRGVMGMASFVDNDTQVRNEFQRLKAVFDTLKQTYYSDYPSFDSISMGMSGDYKIALEEGSTMVRVGSKLFT